MVSPKDSLEAVERAVKRSDKLPDQTSYLLEEVDAEGSDADVSLPVVEMELIASERVRPNNSDLVGYKTDASGNRIGRVYHSQYEMSVEINIWTAEGGSHDPDDLGERLREALYMHSTNGPARPFRDVNERPIDSIIRFQLGDGERADELVQSPTLRRWRQEIELWGHDEFTTSDDTILEVDFPQDLSSDDTVIED